MRAVQIAEFGGPEVLTLADLPIPEPGPGEVSIDVAYAGLNFADLLGRSIGYRVPDLPFVLGLELSGRVRALGAGVTEFVVGQPVAAIVDGGAYAEVAVVSAATVFAVPDGIALRTAATLPTVVPTAYALVNNVARVRAGETVLVQAAAGGVGSALAQMAKIAGAETVYGVVSSDAKAEFARGLGYDEVFVGDSFDAEVAAATSGRGVDVIFDSIGGKTLARGLASLARFGRVVSYGNAGGEQPWQVGMAELGPRGQSIAGFSILSLTTDAPDVLQELADSAFTLVSTGAVRLPITAEFALAEIADAHRLMGGRTSTGKVVLAVNP
ncbi:quinone oxidoreductase family protein [Nocardia thailandica]